MNEVLINQDEMKYAWDTEGMYVVINPSIQNPYEFEKLNSYKKLEMPQTKHQSLHQMKLLVY